MYTNAFGKKINLKGFFGRLPFAVEIAKAQGTGPQGLEFGPGGTKYF
jgi:hypothetical protein